VAIDAGTRFGHYHILSPIGAGGMGEVYCARDTRLDREVAIKVLPASFANDGDRLRRFKQEALATSALNHPNILTIHDIGDYEGAPFIVAELLEGEELREQLNEGALPVRRSIEYARQIADGLAAAHEKGIVHRDLKPENLFVTTDGRVKILDFGLAKLKPPQVGAVDTDAPTQKKSTDPGTVLGTVGYMSPEQVRGQEADHRSDIFSFGMILYEMLSGKRAFNGDSVADVMSAVLKEEPPELGETNAKISPALEKIVRRCLEKKPERRFQTASDLGFALEALSTPSGSRLETAASPAVDTVSATTLRRSREKWWMGVAALAMLMAVAFAWAYFTRQPAADVRSFKTSILPPEKSSFGQIAVSPDGRHLAFTAATSGNVQLWVRALDSTEATALAGTQGAAYPFWSPDSRFIGFFADGRLKKIEATGGPVQTICEVPAPLGGAWSRDGVILFGQGLSGLLRISATGGDPTPVTTFDRSRQEISHRYPAFLPDGRHFLYSILSGQKETRGVYLGSLDGTLKQLLLDDITVIKYVAAVPGDAASGAGWLLFGRDGALLAQPFDTSRLEFTGELFSLSAKVGSDLLSPNYFSFSVSDNDVLVFDPSLMRKRRQYRWVDRRGQQLYPIDVDAGNFSPGLSPDEKRFIDPRPDPLTGTPDLWLFDVSGGATQRFTIDPALDFAPVWSPDGGRIVWASNREGGIFNIYQKAASGAGEEMLLLKSDYHKFPTDWSRDGRFIVYYQVDPKTKRDVWVLPEPGHGQAKPFPVVQTEANEIAGRLSPDGRWLAYASDVSGRYEVWVQSFPGGGGKRQVSTGGGNHPHWRRDGRELFYYARDGKLMSVPVRSRESFEISAAVSLFDFRAGTQLPNTPYAVTGDGQRFLINAVVDVEPNAALTVWVNWTAGVKK
jgi:serine/threonine protein kinase/Tol biopolymer transport system component